MNEQKLREKYIAEQFRLRQRVDTKNVIQLEEIRLVAGVDLAYWKMQDVEYAVCCIVVIDYRDKGIVERKYSVGEISVPYIPGCLAFREIPLFLETKKLLDNEPDVYVFDGNGYLHPRHMGIATHAGIIIDKPSIGIAKTYYKIRGAEYCMPLNQKFAYTDILVDGVVLGRAVRTVESVKPIFLSVGNKINLDVAMLLIQNMTNNESHIPLPTRLADIMTHEIRRKYTDKQNEPDEN